MEVEGGAGQRPGVGTMRRVAVLVPQTYGYPAGVLQGIARYLHGRRGIAAMWQDPQLNVLGQVAAWKPDGVVAYLYTKEFAAAVVELGVPVVNVSGVLEMRGIQRISVNNSEVGMMAADYFLRKNFRSFACLYSVDRWFMWERAMSFYWSLLVAGHLCRLHSRWFYSRANVKPDAPDYYRDLRNFLASLEKPCGLFCVNDDVAQAAVAACGELGIRVPEDVAVLGADDNAIVCQLVHPPLSSIRLPLEEIGYGAMEMLEQQMDGVKGSGWPRLLTPTRVVTRQSTDVMAIADGEVERAVRFIHANAHRPISVEDVLREVAVSRRVLEMRFKKELGRSPMQEIQRAHVELAKVHLADTDWALPEVAKRSGFTSAVHFSTLFRLRAGIPPSRYRKQVKGKN